MVKTFKDQSFKQRFGAMGDEAEAVFEMVYPRGFVRYGLNRPAVSLKDVPPFIRFTPDYLTSHGLVEVQGFGADRTCKFKCSKLDALEAWNVVFPVTFFLYDKTQQRFTYLAIGDVMEAAEEHGDLRNFPEGTTYWAVPADDLDVEWTDL